MLAEIEAPENVMADDNETPEIKNEDRAQLLGIDQLKRSKRIQPREGLDKETVAHYATLMREGTLFLEVVAYRDTDGQHWLADGFHRVTAAIRCGRKEIEVEVREGSRDDAAFYAAGANARHGLPLNNADKRRVTARLLRLREAARNADPEGTHLSDRAIARHIGVTQPFVSKLQKELFPASSERGKEETQEVAQSVSTETITARENNYHLKAVTSDDQAAKVAESLVVYVMGYFRERAGIPASVLSDALARAIPVIESRIKALSG